MSTTHTILAVVRDVIKRGLRTLDTALRHHYPHYVGVHTNINAEGLLVVVEFDGYYRRNQYRSKCWYTTDGESLVFQSLTEGLEPILAACSLADPSTGDLVRWSLRPLLQRIESVDRKLTTRPTSTTTRVTY